jgi:hypothetical protein
MQYIAFDAHKHYTLASVARPDGQVLRRSESSTNAERSRSFWRAVSQVRP